MIVTHGSLLSLAQTAINPLDEEGVNSISIELRIGRQIKVEDIKQNREDSNRSRGKREEILYQSVSYMRMVHLYSTIYSNEERRTIERGHTIDNPYFIKPLLWLRAQLYEKISLPLGYLGFLYIKPSAAQMGWSLTSTPLVYGDKQPILNIRNETRYHSNPIYYMMPFVELVIHKVESKYTAPPSAYPIEGAP